MKENRIITTRSAGRFLTCRRRYRMEILGKLSRNSRPFRRSRDMDDAIRDMLTAGHLAVFHGDNHEVRMEQALHHWLEGVAGDDEEAREAFKIAANIAKRYFLTINTGAIVSDSDGQPVIARQVSAPISVPCLKCGGLGCESCQKMSEPGWRRASRWAFATTLDLAVENRGEAWLIVRRMTSDSDRRKIADGLELRFNDNGLVWALSAILGRPVAGIMYEVIRRAIPKDPATVKCRKCGGSGTVKKGWQDTGGGWHEMECDACNESGVGGISKAPCDTDLETWWATANRYPHLNQEKLKADHAKQLEDLRSNGETFIWRYARRVSTEDMASWRNEIYQVAKDIEHAQRDVRWPRNPGACNAPGRPCPYRMICAKKNPSQMEYFSEVPVPEALQPWRPAFARQVADVAKAAP